MKPCKEEVFCKKEEAEKSLRISETEGQTSQIEIHNFILSEKLFFQKYKFPIFRKYFLVMKL